MLRQRISERLLVSLGFLGGRTRWTGEDILYARWVRKIKIKAGRTRRDVDVLLPHPAPS